MKVFIYISAAVCAYLISGINPAIIFSNKVYHKDIRACGSGNPGFTNFKRCFGGKLAWLVLVLDLTKSAIATAAFAQLFQLYMGNWQFGAAYTGLFALLGHAYPIYYKFKGGKGFLVYMSVIWFIDLKAGIIALAIMLILLAATKYMSLATVTAMLSCPITLFIEKTPAATVLLCSVSVIYIALRHKENFKRLIHGSENKFTIKKHLQKG